LRRYTPEYRQIVTLRDGQTTQLRLLQPEDRDLLVQGFSELSEMTRYHRFFAHKRQLTRQDLDYLTVLDHERHVALGATRSAATGQVQPMGVARFICGADPREAEAAVVVVDAHQRLGLGRLLLEHLGEAAAERGIETLLFTTLAINRGLFSAVRSSFSDVRTSPIEDGTCTLSVSLESSHAHPLRWARRSVASLAEAQLSLLRRINGGAA